MDLSWDKLRNERILKYARSSHSTFVLISSDFHSARDRDDHRRVCTVCRVLGQFSNAQHKKDRTSYKYTSDNEWLSVQSTVNTLTM
jgi:hypothetical protein